MGVGVDAKMVAWLSVRHKGSCTTAAAAGEEGGKGAERGAPRVGHLSVRLSLNDPSIAVQNVHVRF